jgi:hypothetical protein
MNTGPSSKIIDLMLCNFGQGLHPHATGGPIGIVENGGCQRYEVMPVNVACRKVMHGRVLAPTADRACADGAGYVPQVLACKHNESVLAR